MEEDHRQYLHQLCQKYEALVHTIEKANKRVDRLSNPQNILKQATSGRKSQRRNGSESRQENSSPLAKQFNEEIERKLKDINNSEAS